jgi:LCP family protein required for cell wall assembly
VQSDEWLVTSTQASAHPAREGLAPQDQRPQQARNTLLRQSWLDNSQTTGGRETPHTPDLTERQTIKQPSFPGPGSGFPGPGMLPRTPDVYEQQRLLSAGAGGQGYGLARSFPGAPAGMAPGSDGHALFTSGALARGQVEPATSPQGLNVLHPGSSFVRPGSMGMVSAPRTPGSFQPEGFAPGAGSFASGPQGPAGRQGTGSKKHKKGRRVPIWARVVIGLLLFFLVLGGAVFAYYQFYFAGAVTRIVGQQVQRAPGEEDPNANLNNGILSGPRINILLLGSDTDQKFQGQYIAQTDIVVTIDPGTHSVGMLSIPRDFYIPIPGYGLHKLDEAYGLGGVDLSRRTIEQDFGIPINYYAWVGLDGFIKVINEVGGVDVDVLHPIVDDNYPDDVGANANNPYALKRLYLAPGPQHLDGPTALEYVRSRHADLVGDFGRSARQQQVLGALKTRLSNPTVFGHLSAIANDLQGYLKTDMQLSDVLKLMYFARSLDLNSINRLILGPPYASAGVAPAGTPDAGADVVFPNCVKIIPAIAHMLQLGDRAACNVIGEGGGRAPLPVAYRAGQPSAFAVHVNTVVDGSQSMTTLPGDTNGDPASLFGMQSLLDLMLMGVFETPDVF